MIERIKIFKSNTLPLEAFTEFLTSIGLPTERNSIKD
jgi:hypothetical protein